MQQSLIILALVASHAVAHSDDDFHTPTGPVPTASDILPEGVFGGDLIFYTATEFSTRYTYSGAESKPTSAPLPDGKHYELDCHHGMAGMECNEVYGTRCNADGFMVNQTPFECNEMKFKCRIFDDASCLNGRQCSWYLEPNGRLQGNPTDGRVGCQPTTESQAPCTIIGSASTPTQAKTTAVVSEATGTSSKTLATQTPSSRDRASKVSVSPIIGHESSSKQTKATAGISGGQFETIPGLGQPKSPKVADSTTVAFGTNTKTAPVTETKGSASQPASKPANSSGTATITTFVTRTKGSASQPASKSTSEPYN